MTTSTLFEKALKLDFLSPKEGLFLFENAALAELMAIAHEIRHRIHPENKVSWIIDRNININNVCVSGCMFCNFHRSLNHPEAYVTTIEQYTSKIKELYRLGGKQILLQGGMHPQLKLSFYVDLFHELKRIFPDLKLHALGPAEIVYLSKVEKISFDETLKKLMDAGLDSLPGGGAEILVDRVRSTISKNKCYAKQWLDVMREAHKLNLTTTATMMFGHIETPLERMLHLEAIRLVQSEKPEKTKGFISFISWPFQDENTILQKKMNIKNTVTADEYIRMIAISRIMLPNIPNIQASWLTVGMETAQVCLHAGANDLGSIMIEENVVSSAGATYSADAKTLQAAIMQAGFEPQLRNQQFEPA